VTTIPFLLCSLRAMPRQLQGQAPAKGGKGGYSSRSGGDVPPGQAALATQCMGEEGRDFLRRYLADDAFAKNIMRHIDEDGYIVLPGILSTAEADAELARAWQYVERVSPSIKHSDWNTWWGSGGGPDPWPHAQRDMMQLHQAGWVFSDLREKVAERVFEKLYGTKDLHVSKDGFTFQRPTNGELGRTPNDHYDQGHRWAGLQCIQGSVALSDQSEKDGCFKVWPGSHNHREEILSGCRHQKARNSDFIIMSADEHDLLRQRGIEPLRVPVKRGDVILWRSDVGHCGAPPIGRCDTSRVVAYVCCLPAALTPEPVYEQKQRAYQRLETGCHYPNREEWFSAGDKHKQLTWRPYLTKPPELTQRQRQLYGLERYNSTRPCAAAQSSDSGDRISAGASGNLAVESFFKSETSPAQQFSTIAAVPGPVPGLELWRAPAAAVRETLVELRPYFRQSPNQSSSDMFEVGWSFHAMESQKVMRIGNPLADFPCLLALVMEVMQAILPGPVTLGDESVNIICRRYRTGQSLPKHLDRAELFDEDVYGCVLLNTSDQALFFEQQSKSRSGDLVEGPHVLDEQPGCCFRSHGPARYEWVHGVKELSHGERISLTWRWIRPAAAADGHEKAKIKGDSAKGKGKSQRKEKNQGNGKGESTVDKKPLAEDTRQDETPTIEIPAAVSAQAKEPKKRWARAK